MNNQSKSLIIITGASSGIGAATAKAFAQLGHPLLLLARRLDRLLALNLPSALCKSVDVTNRNEVIEAIQEAEQQFGPTGGLVNNAGVLYHGEFYQQDPASWENMVNVNIMGMLNCTHAVLPSMIQRQTGTIINISSNAGRITNPNYVVYCGTKHAVHAISAGLREAVAPHNVRVIIIAPGYTETEIVNTFSEAEIAQMKQRTGFLSANDIAKTITFAWQQPHNICMREILVAPTRQDK